MLGLALREEGGGDAKGESGEAKHQVDASVDQERYIRPLVM